jgi:enterochelin esterase family protein
MPSSGALGLGCPEGLTHRLARCYRLAMAFPEGHGTMSSLPASMAIRVLATAGLYVAAAPLALGQTEADSVGSSPAQRAATHGARGVMADGGPRGVDVVASPMVEPDRNVTFRVRAPEASRVTLMSDFQDETPLAKGADGVWSVTVGPLMTVGPLTPDIYYYNFVVDGVRTFDPGNSEAKIGYYASTLMSIVDVSGAEPTFYDVKDVPHGELRTSVYNSQSNGVIREMTVYVPPGYDEQPERRYPVLYLLHGNANDHHSWQRYGRANEILDNLVAEGAIEPFLVVMPLGYGGAAINGDGVGVGGPARPPGGRSLPAGPDLYEQDLLHDIIPMIDAKYRTIPDRRSRAIVGFSMGGGQAARIGLGHLDTFSRVGVMSAGMGGGLNAEPLKSLAVDVAAANEQIDLLWIGCGREDFAFAGASELSKSLDELKIEHKFHESEGGHHWRVWRRYLHELAPKLFSKSSGSRSNEARP